MIASRPRRRSTIRARRYHHGNLRTALLEAAEAELDARGIEGFSLRGVAKRAGVSHAAPAHHFGDVNGLLTALAAVGYRRLVKAQELRRRKAATDEVSQMVASGIGYIDCAMAHPALFRLMFSSDRPDHDAPDLRAAAAAAFQLLIDGVQRLRQLDQPDEKTSMLGAAAAWAMVHGLADLMNAGRLKVLLGMQQREREAALSRILRRSVESMARSPRKSV